MDGCAAQAAQAVGAPPAILAMALGAPCVARRIERGWRRRRENKSQSFGAFFFPPASGKIHMATIMKAAVARMKFPNSGRTDEPLQNARTSATTATAAET